jgi:hypothetical protein
MRTCCLLAALVLGGCTPTAARIGTQTRNPMNVPRLPLDMLDPVPLGNDEESREAAENLAALRLSFARACLAYEAGDYRSAAESFMAAARAARGALDSYTRRAMANQRASCYRNAAKAWYMAGALAGGRRELEDAAREDPSCEVEIQAILALLGDGH